MSLSKFDVPAAPLADLTVTIPTVTGTYASGDNVGGKLTFTNAVGRNGDALLLRNVTLVDLSNQKIVGELLIFDSDPSASTSTDNAAQTIATADASKVIARVTIAAADYVTIDSKGIASLALNPRVLKAANSGRNLYAVFVTTGAPTYGNNSLLLQLGVEIAKC